MGTKEVHNKPCSGIRASASGRICVMSSDGFISLVDLETLAAEGKPRKLHNMPISSAVFREESNTLVTVGLDYRYNFVPLSSFSAFNEVKNLLMYMAIAVLVLLYFIDYLV